MYKAFKFFNLFSQSPSLRINGDFKPSSIFGSIIGFITIIITIVAIFFILFDYFSRLNFNVSSYTDNLARPEINLNEFKLGLLLSDLLGQPIPDQDRLYSISAKHWNIHLPKVEQNKTSSVKIEPIPSINCDYDTSHISKERFNFLEKSYKMSCFDFRNRTLSGVYGNALE
jgi:hypothetical protein